MTQFGMQLHDVSRGLCSDSLARRVIVGHRNAATSAVKQQLTFVGREDGKMFASMWKRENVCCFSSHVTTLSPRVGAKGTQATCAHLRAVQKPRCRYE